MTRNRIWEITITICNVFSLVIFISILYLSWKSNPEIRTVVFFPDWISDWTDHPKNNQIRTGVPFLLLGILLGLNLKYHRKGSLQYWILVWLILINLVFLVEFIQLFIPSRHMDFMDVFWGGLGSGFGLGLIYLILKAFNLFKV